MSKTYDLTNITDIFRAIAKAKKVKWSIDSGSKRPLSSFKNPSVKNLSFVTKVLGVKVSEIFLIQENPALFDELVNPQVEPAIAADTVVVIQENGGEPVTGEDGGAPITGESGGEPVQS